jgi:hypothetical protein
MMALYPCDKLPRFKCLWGFGKWCKKCHPTWKKIRHVRKQIKGVLENANQA